MRYVSAGSLQEGMVLGRTLHRKYEVMLNQGVVLTQQYINSIRRCGFAGAYIQDELSSDIEIEPLVSDELLHETAKRLERFRDIAKFDDGNGRSQLPDITGHVENIVTELCKNKDVMVNMMDLSSYDSYTYAHSLNVTMLSVLVGASLGFPHNDLVGLGMGALLHDIGKIHINKRILLKNGPLTDEEFEIIKKHPQDGFDYIRKRFHLPTKYLHTILEHHEKFDGTGYPNGKKGNEISLYGRICAVADVYDAVSSKRPYRNPLPVHECVEYIMAGSSTLFDPEVVYAFIRRIAPYPLGTSVTLSNGWTGLVIANYSDYSLRPKLRIYRQDGELVPTFEISLKDDPKYLNVTITGVT